MTTSLILLSVLAMPNTLDDSIHRRALAVLNAEGFAQIHAIVAQAQDIPFRLATTFRNENRGLAVTIDGGQITRPSKESALQRWGVDSAVTPPEGSLSGLSLGEKCAYIRSNLGVDVKTLTDRYNLRVRVTTPRGEESLTDPTRKLYAETLCERIARVVLADAMAIDLADDGRELGTSRMTGNEAPKDGYVTLESWAAASSVAVAFDAKTASATFTVNNKAVKLLLASDKAIVAGQQVELGGKFILARGTRWFVPDRELTAAVR